MPTIRISEETKSAINELGNTFDSADDVLQRLLREAGYHESLRRGDEEEDMSKDSRSASEAKDWLTTQLESHPEVQDVSSSQVKGNRDALDAVIGGEKVRVWPKYSKFAGQDNPQYPPFYGSTWEMTDKLRGDYELYIAFLGSAEDSCWVVPFEDFYSRFDFTEEAKEGMEWKFNFEQGDSRTLLEEYSGIDSLFE